MQIRVGLGEGIGKACMRTKESVVLYIREGCGACKRAMDYLTDRSVGYRTVDVGSNGAALEELERLSQQSKTPTIAVGDDCLSNFDVADLPPFLRKYHLDRRPG
jgi:glutaredoxin